MISENEVLKIIMKCKNSKNETSYEDLLGNMGVDGLTLIPLLNDLEEKGYIHLYSTRIYVTPMTISIYYKLK